MNVIQWLLAQLPTFRPVKSEKEEALRNIAAARRQMLQCPPAAPHLMRYCENTIGKEEALRKYADAARR